MTEELVGREAAKPASDRIAIPFLQQVHRLHVANDEGSLLGAAADLLSHQLGSAPSTIRVAHDDGTVRVFGAQAGALGELAERAGREGIPAIDDRHSGLIAFPVRGPAGRLLGTVAFSHAAVGRLAGAAMEVLALAVGQVVFASVALDHRSRPESRGGESPDPGITSLHDAKLAFERRLLEVRLAQSRGNVAAAARSLDMDRGQLSRLMKKHGLERQVFKGGAAGATESR